MGLADEDLREDSGARAFEHLLAKCRVLGDVELGKRGLFARQQRFGGAAITAPRAGVDFDGGGHDALALEAFELYGSFGGVHNPRKYQDIDLGRLGAQKRPRAGMDRRPRGEDIVNQNHPTPRHVAFRSVAILNAPCTLSARSDRDRPICCWVGRTRRSSSEASLTPLWRSITRA